jgi:hypothetical protein
MDIKTVRQRERKAGKRTDRKTGRQTDFEIFTSCILFGCFSGRQQALRQPGKQEAGSQAARQAAGAGGQKGWEESRKDGSKAGGQEFRHADIRMYRKWYVQIYIKTYRKKTYSQIQINRQTDSAEVQEGRQTNRQMYKKMLKDSVHAYGTYIQKDIQNRQTQKGKQTDRQTHRQCMCDLQNDFGRNLNNLIMLGQFFFWYYAGLLLKVIALLSNHTVCKVGLK